MNEEKKKFLYVNYLMWNIAVSILFAAMIITMGHIYTGIRLQKLKEDRTPVEVTLVSIGDMRELYRTDVYKDKDNVRYPLYRMPSDYPEEKLTLYMDADGEYVLLPSAKEPDVFDSIQLFGVMISLYISIIKMFEYRSLIVKDIQKSRDNTED